MSFLTGRQSYLVAYLYDANTGQPITGAAGTLTVRIYRDGATTPDVISGSSITEVSAANAPGFYWVAVSDTIMQGNTLLVVGSSTVADSAVRPLLTTSMPILQPTASALYTDASGNVRVASNLDKENYTLSTSALQQVAREVLIRDVTGDEGTAGTKSLARALGKLLNRVVLDTANSRLVIYRSDGTTPWFSQAYTTAASALPISSLGDSA